MSQFRSIFSMLDDVKASRTIAGLERGHEYSVLRIMIDCQQDDLFIGGVFGENYLHAEYRPTVSYELLQTAPTEGEQRITISESDLFDNAYQVK